MRHVLVAALVACAGATVEQTRPAVAPTADRTPDAGVALTPDAAEPVVVVPPPPPEPERWLRGSTHVHARPSGDSTTPIADVIAWYEGRGYDFIALTDHNQVSEVDATTDTTGKPAVRDPASGLIVLAGIELTHNPSGCVPAGDASQKCRIHVNALGATARPRGKLDWPDRATKDRVAKYESALVAARALGPTIAQVNHPQWFWGMTADVLVEIARRGIVLYEVANVQFPKWNAGDKDHPSTEALWDAALVRGATLWAVASDDAHHYSTSEGGNPGKYPAGGGWVVVKARRSPQAILEALAAGRFYASTGVVLDRAEVVANELVVDVAPGEARHVIELVENGKLVQTIRGASARRAVPATGYVRAVVTRADGAKAWVQPARR